MDVWLLLGDLSLLGPQTQVPGVESLAVLSWHVHSIPFCHKPHHSLLHYNQAPSLTNSAHLAW